MELNHIVEFGAWVLFDALAASVGRGAGGYLRQAKGIDRARRTLINSGKTGSIKALRGMKTGAAAARGTAETMMNVSRGMHFVNYGVGAYYIGSALYEGASSLSSYLSSEVPDMEREITQAQQFVLPKQAHTQRQRALQAIHASQMTTRAAIGHEAEYAHR